MPKKVTPRGKAATPQQRPIAPKASKRPSSRKRASAPKTKKSDYIRNLWGSEVRITLSEANEERKIELKPRGQRGDLARVSVEEWEDDKMDRTLVELIDGELAKVIMDAQLTNQQAPHSALEVLRNEYGQSYQGAPRVHQGPPAQTVAQLQQAQGQGRIDQVQTVVREPGAAPTQAAVPGSIQNPVPAQTQDWLARQKGSEADASAAADALRESLNPTVKPTQRDITPGQ